MLKNKETELDKIGPLEEHKKRIESIINQFKQDEFMGPNFPPTYKQFSFNGLIDTIFREIDRYEQIRKMASIDRKGKQ